MWVSRGLLFLFCVTLFSCGPEGTRAPASSTRLLGQTLVGERALRNDERALLLDMCYGLRSAWTEFRHNQRGKKFRFDFEQETCQKSEKPVREVLELELVHMLDSAPMIYDGPYTLPYFQEMETHLHGRLAPLCQRALKGESISTRRVENNQIVDIRLREDGEFAFYDVVYADSESEEVTQVEIFKIYLKPQEGAANQFLKGSVVEMERWRSCGEGTRSSFVTQTLVMD